MTSNQAISAVPYAAARSSAGFSLVEILVGMVIALISMLVVLQVYALNEGQKRTTTSGVDAQQSSLVGLHLLERDLRQAGYGVKGLPAPCLSPPIAIAGPAGARVITLMYSKSAVGNVNAEGCNDTNTAHYRYSVVANGAHRDLQREELDAAGNVAKVEKLVTDVVALAAEPLPNAAAPTAIRVAVATRSNVREKPDPAAGCDVTPQPLLMWPGGPAVTPPDDGSGIPDTWKCYRYRVQQTIVPLRNLVW